MDAGDYAQLFSLHSFLISPPSAAPTALNSPVPELLKNFCSTCRSTPSSTDPSFWSHSLLPPNPFARPDHQIKVYHCSVKKAPQLRAEVTRAVTTLNNLKALFLWPEHYPHLIPNPSTEPSPPLRSVDQHGELTCALSRSRANQHLANNFTCPQKGQDSCPMQQKDTHPKHRAEPCSTDSAFPWAS